MSEVRLRLLRSVGADSPPTLEQLMSRAARGDEEAFSALYDGLSSLVYGVVLQVVRDPAQAEEVAQEVFVEVWRVAPRFDPARGSVRSWVATIAHRKSVDSVRAEQSRRDREQRDQQRSSTPPTDATMDQVVRTAEIERVQESLQALTLAQRESVSLAYFGGHTYREVAALLDIPEGTVKTRIRDGLIKLRDNLESNS